MNKVLFLIIMMFFLTSSYGQDQKEFIEVTVEDSLQVEPEEIFYQVMLSPSHTVTDSVPEENTPPVTTKHKIEELEIEKLYKLIYRMKIDTLSLTEINILTYEYRESDKTIILHFRTKKKLEEFIKEAKKIEGMIGTIASLKHSKIEIYEQQLTKKLLTKAKNNATFIAEQSGKKLGRLLQVREQLDESQGGWTVYPPLSALSQANFPNVSDKIILNKKFVVRYAW